MNLTARVDENYFKELAKKHFLSNKFYDAGAIISKFKFHAEFDCFLILEKLAMTNKMGMAK